MLGVVEAGDIANYARNRPVQHAASDFTWQEWWNGSDASITEEADAAVDPNGDMVYDGTKSGNYLDEIKALDDFLTKPQKLADSTEYELYAYLLNHGYEVQPLSRGSFKEISL